MINEWERIRQNLIEFICRGTWCHAGRKNHCERNGRCESISKIIDFILSERKAAYDEGYYNRNDGDIENSNKWLDEIKRNAKIDVLKDVIQSEEYPNGRTIYEKLKELTNEN